MVSEERAVEALDGTNSGTSIMASLTVDPDSSLSAATQKAIQLTRHLQSRANELQTPQERRQQAELDRMIQNPHDKITLMQMTDQAFRSEVPQRAVDQMIHILDVQGIPRFFTPWDRTLLRGFQSFGSYLPGVAVPMVKEKMQRETANVILPAESNMLAPYLRERANQGLRMNVNFLGEALLGEGEAEVRQQTYLKALQDDAIEVISVKISTIYSQISQLAREHTLKTLVERLEILYRNAAKATFRRPDGTEVPKFVYLDMEEYRDLALTAEAFMRTLDLPALKHAAAGIALQAYIPDSLRVQRELNAWARRRVADGGHPITIRLVKGANMEMECVEASLMGWPQAPFDVKKDTDANYKAMLHEGLTSENIGAVRLGIASHNLFEVAYAFVLAHDQGVLDCIQFEMLEGMANHQRRALYELCQNVLLYAPACRKEEFIHAIGYLVRRLDENTGPENFLRHAFRIEVDSPEWEMLEQRFIESFDAIDDLTGESRRTQNRFESPEFEQEDPFASESATPYSAFRNEPDTDFSLPHNAEWAAKLVESRLNAGVEEIPVVVAGEEHLDDRELRTSTDPSRPGVTVAQYREASPDDLLRAVATAKGDPDGWRTLDSVERRRTLRKVAHELRVARGELIGVAMVDGGKTIAESDPEVSEAIDFAEFYSLSAIETDAYPSLDVNGLGVVVVVSPWNFPIAIPCGGVIAALAAGNTVILKPASDTVFTAYAMCQALWRAGVSKNTLQFVPCSGRVAGEHLTSHEDVNAVVLTGGTETAWRMLEKCPTMHLLAETGGKNATIVTAMADRDQAVKHILHSAFSHGGQKCSATSLLILEEEVYNDTKFREALCDAVASIRVGPAHELHSKMGPLIRPPSDDLERALKELEPGESWAVVPHQVGDNPNLYSPGVKWGVEPGSYAHLTEFFGPVLGVMKARNLHEAIEFANQTGYGLTSGLESLDDREQAIWLESIRAGNLYVNRPTTGAIVLRQPFGGMGKSAFGAGVKAGGPNYIWQLSDVVEKQEDIEFDASVASEELGRLLVELKVAPNGIDLNYDRICKAVQSYVSFFKSEFGGQHDHFELIGQDNIRRYLPVSSMRIRYLPSDSVDDLLLRICAAKIVGCRTTLSYDESCPEDVIRWLDELTHDWAGAIEFHSETDEMLAESILSFQTERIRYAAPDNVPLRVRNDAAKIPIYIADQPVIGHGRIELMWYLKEQSLSIDYHRYGNLLERGIR